MGGDDAAGVGEAGDGVVRHGPKRVAGRHDVEAGGGGTVAVRTPDEPEGAVELGDVVEEDVEIERQRIGNAVLAMMGGKIGVPLPDIAAEGRLHVPLGLP